MTRGGHYLAASITQRNPICPAALVTSPDVLLLDEPTNHLDLDGILWLERALASANACLIVTHDRYFLENVATQMAEINPAYQGSAFQVKGNYSEFLERREEFFEAQSKQQESLATKVKREADHYRGNDRRATRPNVGDGTALHEASR